MPLERGTRLGAYEITSALGAGGMGEVYRARDTRLERSVAIKVLPAEFANDAQLRLRFEREAKAISQLNHPHICTLYDVGHQDGVDYLVMELLEGQTLADRISRGPMPPADVIRYGVEIAEALDKAHRNGVVHRDLKPGNIMITKSGAKLLDFGLAKTGRDSVLSPESSSLTAPQQKPLTTEGTVVGTYQYMSPEQLSGDPVDHRTDLFALGAVLYEMVTGRRAFPGKTQTSIVAAILGGKPVPPSQIQAATPPALEQLIGWCLAKDRDARMQSAHDVALELGAIGETRAIKTGPARLPWLLAALFGLIAIAGGVAAWKARQPESPEETRFDISAPPGTNHYTHASISPDGRRIVFRAGDARGRTQLYLRDLASTRVQPLAGTEDAVFMFWAPDNRQIGFTARGKLLRMNVDTGEVRTLAENITQGGGASWSRNGVILFSPRPESILYRVNATGGEPVAETKLVGSDTHHIWPWFLPDGEHYLFVVAGSDQSRAGIYLGKLGSSERTFVMPHPKRTDFTAVAYGGGQIFYVRDFALMAQKFDWEKRKLSGVPIKVDEGMELGGPGRTTLSVSESGTLVFRKFGAPVIAQLFLADRTGRQMATVGPESWYRTFTLSKDEKKIAVGRDDAPPSVWIVDAVRGTATRLGFDRYTTFPQWLSDSRAFVFSLALDTPPNLMMIRGGANTRLTRAFQQQYATGVSPDDAWVFFNANQIGGFDINAVSIAPPHKVIPVLATRFSEYDATPSPDGKWLAYVSNENGTPQVFAVQWSAAPGGASGASKFQISTTGGELPRWSKDGREIYYLDPNRTITAVNIETEGDDLRASIPQPLFAIDNALGFEPTRDRRFLVARTRLNPDATPLTVVEGWGK